MSSGPKAGCWHPMSRRGWVLANRDHGSNQRPDLRLRFTLTLQRAARSLIESSSMLFTVLTSASFTTVTAQMWGEIGGIFVRPEIRRGVQWQGQPLITRV